MTFISPRCPCHNLIVFSEHDANAVMELFEYIERDVVRSHGRVVRTKVVLLIEVEMFIDLSYVPDVCGPLPISFLCYFGQWVCLSSFPRGKFCGYTKAPPPS